MGHSVHRRSDRLPVDQGHHRRRRQSRAPKWPIRSRCAAARAPCWCWSSSPATSPDGARTPSSSSRVLGDTQYMNHIRPRQLLRARICAAGSPALYIDTGFDRTAHNVDVRRIAVRTRPLQHSEHRHLSLVAERLQRHQRRAHGGCDQRRDRPALLPLQLAGHGHSAVPPRRFARRADHRRGAAGQCRRSPAPPRLCDDLTARRRRRLLRRSATASSSTLERSAGQPLSDSGRNLSGADGAGPTCPRPAALTPSLSIPSSAASRLPPAAGSRRLR